MQHPDVGKTQFRRDFARLNALAGCSIAKHWPSFNGVTNPTKIVPVACAILANLDDQEVSVFGHLHH